MGYHMTTKARINVQSHTGEWYTHYLAIANDATPPDLKRALQRHGVTLDPSTTQQFIANGTTMGNNDSVAALGENFFRSNAIYVRPIDTHACIEWQRTGRCSHGGSCPLCASHKPERSPRYIAHHAEISPSTSTSTSPATSPAPSPRPNEPSRMTPEPASTQPPRKQQTICRHWANSGSCRFGDRCFFAHTHTLDNGPKNTGRAYPPEFQPGWHQQHTQCFSAPVLLSSEPADPQWQESPPPVTPPYHEPTIGPQQSVEVTWDHLQMQTPQMYPPQQQPYVNSTVHASTITEYTQQMDYSYSQLQPPPTKPNKRDTWHYYSQPQLFSV